MLTIHIEELPVDGARRATMERHGHAVEITAATDTGALRGLAAVGDVLTVAGVLAQGGWSQMVAQSMETRARLARDTVVRAFEDGDVSALTIDGRAITPAGLGVCDMDALVTLLARRAARAA